MGGSRKKQTQSSTENFTPPAWAMPLFQTGAKDAQDLYQAGGGGNVYQGKRVADLGEASMSGLQGLQAAMNGFSDAGLQSQLGKPTAAQSNLADMASGKYLSQGSPYYQDRLNEAINGMAAKVNSQMSGAGRYGSGANSDILAKNTGSMLLSGLDNDYGRAMQNMLGANGQIDAANQNALTGAGDYLRSWSNAANAQLQGGQAADERQQAQLDAEREKWEDEDNRGWRRLQYLQNAANGFAGDYGTKTGKTSATARGRSSPLDTAASIAGLMRKSDCRAKENIIPAGCRCGFPLYEFQYKGEKQRRRGVMAQDVLRLKPEAVSVDKADGLYCVDYGLLGFDMENI